MAGLATVHWTQPGLQAMPETDGHGDTCGPIVIADYMHVINGAELSIPAIDALRSRLIGDGLMGTTGGMTLGEIMDALARYWGVTAAKYVGWGNVNTGTLHNDLLNAMQHRQAMIVESHNAQGWPDNQQGVQNHFILIWGWDSTLGYWVANGDTYTNLRFTTPQSPVWYTWSQLLNGDIQSYLILPAQEPNMILLDKDASGNVMGAHDAANPALHIGAGMALAAQQAGDLTLDIHEGEQYYGAQSVAVLANSSSPCRVYTYSPQFNVNRFAAADLAIVVAGLMEGNRTLEAQLADCKAQPPAPAPIDPQAIADLQDALKRLGA